MNYLFILKKSRASQSQRSTALSTCPGGDGGKIIVPVARCLGEDLTEHAEKAKLALEECQVGLAESESRHFLSKTTSVAFETM